MDPEAGVAIADIGSILNSLNASSPCTFDDLLLCSEKSSDDYVQQALIGGYAANCYSVNVDKEVEIINYQQSGVGIGEQQPFSNIRHETASSAYLSPQCVSTAPSISRASSAVCGPSPIPVGYLHSQYYSSNGFVPPPIQIHPAGFGATHSSTRPIVQPQAAYANAYGSGFEPAGYSMNVQSAMEESNNGLLSTAAAPTYQPNFTPTYAASQTFQTLVQPASFQLTQNGQSAFQPTQPFIAQQSLAINQAEASGRSVSLASPFQPFALTDGASDLDSRSVSAEPFAYLQMQNSFQHVADANVSQQGPNVSASVPVPAATSMQHFPMHAAPVQLPPATHLLTQPHTQVAPAQQSTFCPLPSIESSYSRNPKTIAAAAARFSPISSLTLNEMPPAVSVDSSSSVSVSHSNSYSHSSNSYAAVPLAITQPDSCALQQAQPLSAAASSNTNTVQCDVKVKAARASPTSGLNDGRRNNPGMPIVDAQTKPQTQPQPQSAATAKNLLKSRLVERFIQRGEEPRIEEKKPLPPVNTPEVEMIRQKRRERNRDAARRTRNNKRRRMAELEQQIAKLSAENHKQEEESRRLTVVLSGLRNRCMNHLIKVKDCPHESEIRRLVTANLESDCADFSESFLDLEETAD